MSNSKMIKKLSVKTVYGDVKPLRKLENGTETKVMTVFGMATGSKSGQSTLPDGTISNWVGLTGFFEGINPVSGEVFQSTSLFLPDIALNMILPMVLQGKNPEFALEIIVVTSDTSNVGFEYSFKPIAQNDDPLAAMREKVLAIAAPNQAALPLEDQGKKKKSA